MNRFRPARLGQQGALADIRKELPFLAAVRFHGRIPPLTHPSYDDTAVSTPPFAIQLPHDSWAPEIPDTAVALSLEIRGRDSAAWGTAGMFFTVGPYPGSPPYALTVVPYGGNLWAYGNGIVPCTGGNLAVTYAASGALTLDLRLRCWGYWI